MYKRLLQKRGFSVFAAILILFSLWSPALAQGDAISENSKSLNEKSVQSKINERVLEQFEDEDDITFLIKMEGKADTNQAAEEGITKAEQAKQTAHQTEMMQRSAVVTALKATAKDSQRNVLDYLDEESENGNASDVHPYYIVNGIAVTATKDVAERIAQFPEVEKILANEKRTLFGSTAKDEQYTKSADDIEWNVDRVGAPDVWDEGIDGSGTVIATIDSGVEWDHPALKEQYRGYDASTGEVDHDYNWYDPVFYDDEPYDDVDHGTHVTGTMVGKEPDGSNQIGVAPGAEWISVKAFSTEGGTDADLLDAAEWIIAPTDYDGNERIDMAPDIVNNSWGGGPGLDEWYRDVVIAWRNANIFPEFSAGNTDLFNPGGPGSVAVPANYPESFATGATDEDDALADFSLRGPSPYDEIKPDISAPGVDVRSSVPGDGYSLSSGTSMAGPAVSGVIALMLEANASLTVNEVEEILLDTAIPKTDGEYPDSPNNGYGYGLLDGNAAVQSVIHGFGAVTGTVTEKGDDDEAPVIDHEPVDEAFSGMDLELDVQASDNVGVSSVVLDYKIDDGNWESLAADLVDGDHQSGDYLAVIEKEVLQGETLEYKWVVSDFSNTVESDVYEVAIESGITVGYSEDFEGDEAPDGWDSFGREDSWEWGAPTSGPGEASSGENVYATNLDGDYAPIMDATLVMPAITLPEGDAYLQFDQWHSFMGGTYPGDPSDYGYVVVSEDADMEEWEELERMEEKSDGWEEMEVDLSDYSGQTIYVGFKVTSDYFWESDGWYLDDMALTDVPMGEEGRSEVPISLFDSFPVEKTKTDLDANPQLLPMKANVTVVETGRSATSDPATGNFTMNHEVGAYTLKADAYGYHPVEKELVVESDETEPVDFTLEEMSEGTITGKVFNEDTEEAVEDATLYLVEDANVTPVTTDEEGRYSLTAYEGDYTLKIIAPGFYNNEMAITVDGDDTLDIAMEPFYTIPGDEIGYDDGSPDNAREFYDAGNGWAVKMSLPEGKESAVITDGVFQFWDDDFPNPGGKEFAVEVWDANGENGMPGEKLAGPIEAEAIRDQAEWTVVDLSKEQLIVDDDFYMVYIQTQDDPDAPGLAMDQTSPNAGRSYQFVEGEWEATPADEGNYMIRARVSYEIDAPEITAPEDGWITNEAETSIEGTATPGTDVKLMNNDEEMDVVTAEEDGTFTSGVSLDEGENDLMAVTLLDGEETKASDVVTVMLDTVAPDLTIDKPVDGEKTNRETVTVEGKASDEHLEDVRVNGKETSLEEDGTFSERILLDNGDNEIEVVARDMAGNETAEVVTLDVKYDDPVVENVLPGENLSVSTGETVTIEMDSEPGLDATFKIQMPLTGDNQVTNATELPMREVSDGHYVGYWTVQTGAVADGAVVEVKAEDDYGNVTWEKADGKLFINQENDGAGKDGSDQVGLLP